MSLLESAGVRHARAAAANLTDASNVDLSLHTRLTCAHHALTHAGMALLIAQGQTPLPATWEARAYETVQGVSGNRVCARVHDWYVARYEPDAGGAWSRDEVERAVSSVRDVVQRVLDRAEAQGLGN